MVITKLSLHTKGLKQAEKLPMITSPKHPLLIVLLAAGITPAQALEKISEYDLANISITAAIKNPLSEPANQHPIADNKERQITQDQNRLLALQNNQMTNTPVAPPRMMEMPVNTALGDVILTPIINDLANTFFGQMGSVAMSGISINTTHVDVSIQGQQVPNLLNMGGSLGIK